MLRILLTTAFTLLLAGIAMGQSSSDTADPAAGLGKLDAEQPKWTGEKVEPAKNTQNNGSGTFANPAGDNTNKNPGENNSSGSGNTTVIPGTNAGSSNKTNESTGNGVGNNATGSSGNTGNTGNQSQTGQTQPQSQSQPQTQSQPAGFKYMEGGFFAQEEIPEGHPGVYGGFEGGSAEISFVLAEAGIIKYRGFPDAQHETVKLYAKSYLQFNIPVFDYFQFQLGLGGLSCMSFTVDANTLASNIEFTDNSERYGWLGMAGLSYLFEFHTHFGMMLWGQFLYGQAGPTDDGYTLTNIRGGARLFFQFSQDGYFTIFGGILYNNLKVEFTNDISTAPPTQTWEPDPLGVELGLQILNVLTIKYAMKFGAETQDKDWRELTISFGTSF